MTFIDGKEKERSVRVQGGSGLERKNGEVQEGDKEEVKVWW